MLLIKQAPCTAFHSEIMLVRFMPAQAVNRIPHGLVIRMQSKYGLV